MKVCSKCKKKKSIKSFSPKGKGYQSHCKLCRNSARRKWRKKNPLKVVAERQTYRQRKRGSDLISVEEYQALLIQQKGVCAICHNPENRISRYSKKKFLLAIDHDHKTGKIRGLLCNRCNRALGMLGDTVEGLQQALDYLKGNS